ncbi:MAG: TonB-dependent receptor [Bacteroidota bacterium]
MVFLLLQMSFLSVLAQTAQDHEISGIITDHSGPLPGVTVTVKGDPGTGSITDVNGSYSITVSPEASTLEASFVGMKTMEVDINGRTDINIIMEVEAIGLEEVVAVGYGYQKKKSLTGAISTVDDDEITTTTATSLAQKLSGKVSGLNIRQNTGEPGAFSNAINIRGFGEPLFVIDGIVRSGSADFQRLNADDIESISVLKDASAAIYGLNAANGVIIVSTKKGAEGKTKFVFSTTTGFSSPTDIPEMANAAQYYEMRNDANVNIGMEPYISQEELANWKAGGTGYESTNWAEETLLKRSMRQEHSLSAEGGSELVSYYVNVGIVKDGGLLQSGDINYKKFNFRTNLSAKLTENLTANISISGFTDTRNSPVDGIFNIWRGTVSILPIHPVYANDNSEYLHRVQDGQAMNPVAIAQSDLAGYTINEDRVFQTSFDLSYKVPFIEGLEFKAVGAYDPRFHQSKGIRTNYDLYDYRAEDDTYMSTTFNAPSSIYNLFSNSNMVTLQVQGIYKTSIAEKHNIGATLVFERREETGRVAGINKFYEFFTNAQIDQAGEENAASNGNEWQVRNLSYLGRLNYNYLGKYLIEFAGRYDGSYRYHPDQRWGFFPVLSGGWRISEEGFIRDNISWISNIKIRGSYGIIGQDAGAPFQYVQAFSTSGGDVWEFTEGKYTIGAASPSIVNKDLTWMESEIKDIGLDLGFFNNKLSFVTDVYQRDRTGLLAYRNVTIPNTFGGTLPQENLNSDRVRGIEFSFNHSNQIGEFIYGVSGNVNFSRSMNVYVESASYTSSWEEYRAGASNRWNDIVWMFNSTGQFQSEEEVLSAPPQNGILGNSKELPGSFRYEDLNGDGVIDGNDTSPMAYNENPKTYYGLNFNVSWKGFDLNLLFQGAANYTARYTHAYSTMFWDEGNLPAYFMDRWHRSDPYNTESEWIPGEWPASRVGMAMEDVGMTYAESDVWRRSATYLRFKNIELGYSLNRAAIQRVGIQNVRVYVNVNNVFTLADKFIKAFDPESIGGSYSAGWTYPILRTVNLGANINF